MRFKISKMFFRKKREIENLKRMRNELYKSVTYLNGENNRLKNIKPQTHIEYNGEQLEILWCYRKPGVIKFLCSFTEKSNKTDDKSDERNKDGSKPFKKFSSLSFDEKVSFINGEIDEV